MPRILSCIASLSICLVALIALLWVHSQAQESASERKDDPSPATAPDHHVDGVDPALCDIAELARLGNDWHAKAVERGITTEAERVLVQVDANLRTNVYDCSVQLREPYRYSAEMLADMRAAFPTLTYIDMGVDTRFRAWVSPLDIPALQLFLVAAQPENVINAYYPNALCYGSINSEGPNAMGVSAYPAPIPTGSGVKVGIVDNGFAGASTTAAAEVGSFTSPQGAVTSGTEVHGTACAEIVRDAAPNCQMRLYALPLGLTDVQAVQDAITNGVQVISRSLGGHGYPGEGDDCDAARLAKQNGIIFCNSAGNYGDRKYWERQNPAIDASLFAEASPGVALNKITTGSATSIWISYTNEQPTGSYARFQAIIYEDAGSGPVAVAQGTAGSTLQSVVYNSVISTRSYYVGIKRTQAGTVGRMRCFLFAGGTLTYRSNVGSIPNPAVLDSEVITVGAVNYSSYTASGSPTSYSSRGGGIWNLPLDFCAPTACSTISYGTSGFSGTSCSCPNTAGLVALQLSHASFASDPINTLTLVNLGVAGWDVDSGWGIVKAPTGTGGTGLNLVQNNPVAVPGTPTNLTITPQTYFWNAVGISSASSSNWNLTMGTGSASGVAGVCDFLVANGNLGSVSNTGSATRASGSAAGTAEHAGLSSLQPGGSEVFLFNGTHIIHLWEVYIQTAGTYPVTVSGTSNTDFKWYLFPPGSDSAWKGAASASYGPYTASVTAQNLSFSSTGYWALVVALNNGQGPTDAINVSVGNPLQIPTITISTSALNLGTTSTGVAGATQAYTVAGTFLSDDITLNAPLTVELSTTGQAGTFTPQLVLQRSGTTVLTTTIYARIAASAAQGSISGAIAHTSTGTTTRNITLSGTVLPPAVPAINVSPATLDLGASTQGSAGAAFGYTLSGTNLTADITVTPPTGVEVSLSQSSGYTTSLNVARSGTSVPNTLIYARISAAATTGAISGNITHASSGATTKNVAVTGTVVAPGTGLIVLSTSVLDLGTTSPNFFSGTPYHYWVEGSGLVADISITAPSGVQLSTVADPQWTTTKTLARTGATVAPTRVNIRIVSLFSFVGTISGNVAHASTGAATKNLAVNGESLSNTSPNIVFTPVGGRSPLALGTRQFGSANPANAFDCLSANLSQDVVLVCPPGLEVSASGYDWDFHAQLSITRNQTIYVTIRIQRDAAVGSVDGVLTAASPGAPTARLFIEGLVTTPTGPTLALSQASLSLNDTDEGVAGIARTYRVAGAALTGDITVTPPADVELSRTGIFGSYSSILTLSASGGVVPSMIIYARIKASASTGGSGIRSITGNIAHVASGAASLNVSANGTLRNNSMWALVLSNYSLALGNSPVGQVGTDLTYTVDKTAATASGQVSIVAPPELEVAIQFTGFPVGTYGSTALNTPPFTVHVRARATAREGQYAGSIRHALFGCNDAFVEVSGEIVPATTPTVFLEPPILVHTLTSQQGAPSAPCTFSVRGYALSNDLIITPPAGLELSTNATTYVSPLALTPTTGAIALTQVYCRVAATAATGTFSAQIAHASVGATTLTMTVQWRVFATESVFCSTSHVSLPTTVSGVPSTAVTFTVSAVNCPTRLDINGSAVAQVSLDGVNFFNGVQSAYSTGGVVPPTTVYMRFSQSTASLFGPQTPADLIIAGNAVSLSIRVSGYIVLAPTRGFEVTSPAGGESWQAGTSHAITWNHFGLQGYYVHVELSADSGQTWSQEIVPYVPFSPGSYTWNIPSTMPAGVSYRIRIRAAGSSQYGASAASFTITAAAPPLVQSSQPSLNLGSTIQGTPGTPQNYVASGDNLGTIPITITPPSGVEIRNASAAGTFSSNAILLMPSNGSVPATNIEVRIAASASIGQPFNDLVQTSGVGTLNITLSGTVNPPPPGISVFPGSLNLGTTTQGIAGAPQSWQVTGANLTANITVTPPAGVEIRNTAGGTFSAAALDLVPVSGSVSATLEARIAASATAAQSFGDITHVSASANQNLTLSGTVLPPPSLNATPNSINLGTTTTGTAGTTLGAYSISGSNLAAAVTVTPPAGVEIRDASGGTFSASPLILNPSAGSVNVNIEARIAATAVASQSFGDITHVSSSASQNVTVSGTVLAQPVLNTTPGSVDLGTTVEGTAGVTIDSYAIAGSNLQSNVTVTPPAGVEIRDAAGGSFAGTALVFVPSSGSVNVTIEVRIAATATAGQSFGVIANSAGSVGSSVTITATVTPVVPVLNVVPNAINLGSTLAGTAGAAFTYDVSGSNLTAPVTVTPPPGAEIRELPAGVFSQTALTLTPVGGTLSTTTIEVRIAATALAGQTFGSITHVSGATIANVALSGTVTSPGGGGGGGGADESGGCTTRAESPGFLLCLSATLLILLARLGTRSRETS
ncbi:MAG: hypothetical protein IT461_06250 [Planctomycetes bacterium]|nr:hypothetical protein [Planctomycetota bacterium]